MLKIISTIAFLVLLGSAAPQAQQAPLQPSPVKRTILQKADVPGTNLEVIYATVEIAPNFKAGRHSHPGVVMAQVVEGEFWFARTASPTRFSRPAKR
jgi:quercetin dioxygenase-like cupin family protein